MLQTGKLKERRATPCPVQEMGPEGKTDTPFSAVLHSGKFLREKDKLLPQKAGEAGHKTPPCKNRTWAQREGTDRTR